MAMLQALFGYHLPGGLTEKPGPNAAAEFARRAGYRLGPNGEWIADDRGSGDGRGDKPAS
jgi:hypothetical protein